jgi:L-ribulose-5-phosphate 3-epimerase
MNQSSISDRLAVCSWSLQPANPRELISKLRETGITRVQLALDPLRENASVWGETPELCRRERIAIVSGMFGCVGEDYCTLESIRLTGGVAPDTYWDQNLKNIRAAVALAKSLALKLVTFHAGFLPHDEKDPGFIKMIRRLNEVAEIFHGTGITLGFETGQEAAPALLGVLGRIKSKEIAVNFDPANMILYDKGSPIEALRALGPRVRQVHIKDARRTKVPGTWGEEVPAGTGEVDWPDFFSVLKQQDFTGDFVIEREAGNQRVLDIRKARELVERLAGNNKS